MRRYLIFSDADIDLLPENLEPLNLRIKLTVNTDNHIGIG
jgi:hypothetical protein